MSALPPDADNTLEHLNDRNAGDVTQTMPSPGERLHDNDMVVALSETAGTEHSRTGVYSWPWRSAGRPLGRTSGTQLNDETSVQWAVVTKSTLLQW
jgi:hypothetical protein